MDLRDLRYFETIAELGHMGRATELLHRSQPALSSCIRRLEQECGAPLFERAGRGMRLTMAGQVLLKWAKRTRNDMQDAQREMADIGQGLSGHVRIGIVPTAAQFLLPPAARQLLAQAPQVTLHAEVGLVETLRPQLEDGSIDLMIGTESPQIPGLVSYRLDEDNIVVAASARHEIHRRQPKLKDLTQYAWMLQPPGAPTRDWLDATFDRHRLPRPRVQVESSMLLLLPALIVETGLLSFVSRHHLTDKHARLKEVPIKETTMSRHLVVTYRENSYIPPAGELLISLLKQAHRS